MKRFVFGVIALLLLGAPFSVSAQRNTVTGAMIIHNTDVIKSKRAKRQYAVADIKKGYQQEVSFAYSFLSNLYSVEDNENIVNQINLNYIGGYRFNHHFFVGIGTGLDFAASMNFKPLVLSDLYGEFADADHCKVGDRVYDHYNECLYGGCLPIQKVSIPLYVHLRAYFTKTKWSPFLAFSAGMRISASKKMDIHESNRKSWDWRERRIGDYICTEKYGAVTAMFEVMPGINYQFSKNLGFNFQFGYATRSGKNYFDGFLNNDWYHGFTMRFGVVF
ncbi:MAG: hypothetical protein IIX40_02435 [Alistipes sp.]|nr:hypothetical protein [Alistipes sp.]